MQTLERHAFPILGGMAVDRISRADVLAVLTPVWGTRPEPARRVCHRIRAVLRWSWAHGYVTENATGDAIDGALPVMPAVKSHLRALPYREVAAAHRTVEDTKASLTIKACFRFVALTATRSGEVRLATWSEIDLDVMEWRIPPSRMKAQVEHRVPLSDSALTVLKRDRPLRGEADLVFPSLSRQDKHLSDMALTKVLRDCASQIARPSTDFGAVFGIGQQNRRTRHTWSWNWLSPIRSEVVSSRLTHDQTCWTGDGV